MAKIIFSVEDEENIAELVRCTLEAFGYTVYRFSCAEDMFQTILKQTPDLILLDIMLPGMDGMEALGRLKNSKFSEIPVILLTAKETEPDKVAGLNQGADDYITKPFGILELTARVNAVLRRSEKQAAKPAELCYRDIRVDCNQRQVTVGGKPVDLTMKEYEILVLLMENQHRIISREEFLNTVWGYEFVGESRTLDIHIKTLRRKLSDDADHQKYIKTIRGIGYSLVS